MDFYIMVGISGSGKSTAARKLQEDTGAVVVSRDDIRMSLFGKAFGAGVDENLVSQVEFSTLDETLSSGYSVISDNTHINMKAIAEKIEVAEKYGARPTIVFVDTALEQALKNNRSRGASGGRFVPESVIKSQESRLSFMRDDLRSLSDQSPTRVALYVVC